MALSAFLLGKPPPWSWAVSRAKQVHLFEMHTLHFWHFFFSSCREILFLYLPKQDFHLVLELFDKRLPVDANQINGVLIRFGF